MNSKQNIQRSARDDLPARIVAAARARFRRFGYAKTSMIEIAGACHMSAANLYRFYSGKLAIAAAVAAADQLAQLAVCDQAVRAARANAAGRLVALLLKNIDATRRRIKQTPLLFELSLRVARERPDLRRQFLDAIETRIIAILASGRKANAAEAKILKARGRLILIASAPFVLPWMMLNEPFGNPRSRVKPLVHSLLSGLAMGPPTPAPSPAPRFS